MKTCPRCDPYNIGYPKLYYKGWPKICLVCNTVYRSDGKVAVKETKKPEGDGDPSNPGNYQNFRRKYTAINKIARCPTAFTGERVAARGRLEMIKKKLGIDDIRKIKKKIPVDEIVLAGMIKECQLLCSLANKGCWISGFVKKWDVLGNENKQTV